MGRFILMRIAGLVPVLLIISIITFLLMHDIPGGPWKYGQRPFTEEQIAALEARYGLDKPLHQQYITWLAGVLRFDFGQSFQHPDESVIELMWEMTVRQQRGLVIVTHAPSIAARADRVLWLFEGRLHAVDKGELEQKMARMNGNK